MAENNSALRSVTSTLRVGHGSRNLRPAIYHSIHHLSSLEYIGPMPSAVFTQVLNFPWEYVVSLFWDRYPNPFSKHVLTSDVLERRLLPDRKLYTKRLILKRGFGKFPAWIRRFASGTKELIVEESLLDMHSQNLRVVTRNVGSLGKYATVIEYCAYTPNTLPGSTVINRALNIESNLNYTIRSPLIYFLSHRYRSTAKGALAGYEYVCNLYKERSPCTHPDSSRRPSTTETFVNATKHRTKEARDFASNSLPRVVRADSGNFRDH